MVYEGSKKRLIITTIWRWVWVGLMGLGTGITVILCGWSSRIQRSILFLQSVSRQGLLKIWTEHFTQSHFMKIFTGWSKGNPMCILGAGIVWTMSFHPQKLHIKIYLLKGQTFFFEFNRSWFFSSYTGILWQITDFELLRYFRIEHNIEFTTFSRRALQILKCPQFWHA